MRIWTIAAAALVFAGQPAAGQTEEDGPTPGTITVESSDGDTSPPAVKQAFAEAVGRALFDAHFTPLPGAGHGRYVARVAVTRTPRGEVAAATPKERAAGNIGNFRVPLPSGKTDLHVLVVTELKVEILRREDGKPVWSGRALTARAQGTRDDAPEVVSIKLAEEVIRSFPAESADPISVP